jgi:chondroitin AC lyase
MEQRLLEGPVTVADSQQVRVLDRGSFRVEAADWICHAGMGYQLLDSQPVHVECQTKTGDWRAVHDQKREGQVKGDVFSLWLDHGASPQAAAYAYAVYPDVTAEVMGRLGESPVVQVLQRTGSLQAISAQQDSIVMAAFFHEGRLTLKDRTWIEVDRPCVMLLDKSDQTWEVYLSDPTHRAASIGIRFARPHATSEIVRELRVELPQGNRAGAAVRVNLNVDGEP